MAGVPAKCIEFTFDSVGDTANPEIPHAESGATPMAWHRQREHVEIPGEVVHDAMPHVM